MQFHLLLSLFVSTLLSPCAHAWDQHHLLTAQLLPSLEAQKPLVWNKLNTFVAVTPVEQFLAKAFSPSCSWELAQDLIFDGLGRDYHVLYVDTVAYNLDYEWSKGISRQHLFPHVIPHSNQIPGSQVKALDVVSTYSDEPDWGLDDDVPRLRGKGVALAGEGMATRLLRHFWYQGESAGGVDFGKDQETDQRAQLYYELALVAFSVDEPYWGYRFLADSLHYLQDITQPFHSRAIITGAMVDKLALVRAKFCEWNPSPRCGAELTVDAQVLKNGWVVAAYHSLYEDFVRGLLSGGFPYSSYEFLRDPNGWQSKHAGVESLPWRAKGPLLDLRQVIPAEQRAVVAFAKRLGDEAYNTFGVKTRYDTAKTQEAIALTSQDRSEGFQIARISSSNGSNIPINARQEKALPKLVATTHQLLLRTGVWSRQFLAQALESLDDPDVREAIAGRRAFYEKKCAAMPLDILARPVAAVKR